MQFEHLSTRTQGMHNAQRLLFWVGATSSRFSWGPSLFECLADAGAGVLVALDDVALLQVHICAHHLRVGRLLHLRAPARARSGADTL